MGRGGESRGHNASASGRGREQRGDFRTQVLDQHSGGERRGELDRNLFEGRFTGEGVEFVARLLGCRGDECHQGVPIYD